jgi:hypothetical protein
VRPVLVKTGKGEQTAAMLADNHFDDVAVYDNLAELANTLLADHS